jgi:hypothetical protein
MIARRLLIVMAVLVALTALAAGVAPRKQSGTDQGASTAPAPARASGTVEKTLDASAIDQRVVARVGQTVVLNVKSDELATINLADTGDETAEPGSPAHFELFADVPGTYAIEELETEQQIGTLEIRKAG